MIDAFGRHHRRDSMSIPTEEGAPVELEFRITARPDDFAAIIGMDVLREAVDCFLRSTERWLEPNSAGDLSNLRHAMRYEPVCFALNPIVERLIFGEQPLPQEIEDAKKAVADCGFRTNWERRDFLPAVYGYPDVDEDL